MRLIDADELIRRIAKWLHDPCGREETLEERVANNIGASVCMEIEEMPTAFDKEKVIEDLADWRDDAEKWAAKYDKIGDVDNMEIQDMAARSYNNAIRIVEKGGIE